MLQTLNNRLFFLESLLEKVSELVVIYQQPIWTERETLEKPFEFKVLKLLWITLLKNVL